MTAEYLIYLLHTDNNGFIEETENIPLKEVNTINNPNTDNTNVLIRKINSDTKALYDYNHVIRKISIILEKKTYELYGEDPYQFKILLFCGKGLNKLNKPTEPNESPYFHKMKQMNKMNQMNQINVLYFNKMNQTSQMNKIKQTNQMHILHFNQMS
jgi:hypothetical protein